MTRTLRTKEHASHAIGMVLAFALLACGKKEVPRASTAPDAAALGAADASADAGPALVELLHAVPSRVFVSSRVDNPRDLPDFIVDGKPETAWNGRSGDLVGGAIGFRVPKDARVAYVLLTVGYDRKTATEDLFTANVRIQTVRISRDRKVLRTVTLDPTRRAPQRIPIDAAGGDYELSVVEVAPGTRKEWRELVVSELAVWGTPGAKVHAKPTAPPVQVGGFRSAAPTHVAPKREASLAAVCATFVRDNTLAFDTLKANAGAAADDDTCEYRCSPGAALPGASSTFLAPVALERKARNDLYYHADFEGSALGVKTSTGAFDVGVPLRGRETALYWTTEYATLSVATTLGPSGRDALVVQVVERRVTDADGAGTPEELHSETVTHHGTICTLDARNELACQTRATELAVKLRDPVLPSPVRTTAQGEIVIDVANAR